MKAKDYVIYGDTDSIYVSVNDFCEDHFGKEWWTNKTDDQKIDIINELSDYIRDYINDRTFNEIQRKGYNSTVDDFKIVFEKEKIAISGIFIKKKKYAVRSLWTEGEKKEKISVTGLETVRSDSSEAIRTRLKDIMDMILRDIPDDQISDRIDKYRKELMKVYPEELAANIGINKLKKYIVDGKATKGTPWQVKGAANYNMLLKELNLGGKYEEITEGIKGKVVYVKPNAFGIESVSFIRWPQEFDAILQVDKKTMVDKFFINKIESLLKPMGKEDILNKASNKVVGLFFK